MAVTRLSDTLIEIDGVVRVEQGPATKVAVACADLLCNTCTAKHYQHNEHLVGKMVLDKKTGLLEPNEEAKADPAMPRDEMGQVRVWRDALGNPIFHGDEITYRDWQGEYVWHVYQLDGAVWKKVGSHATEAVAIFEATKLALGVAE